MPTHSQNVQKSFQDPAREKRNLKKMPHRTVGHGNENKNEKKIKHESTTMCIVHSTLRDATTPYTKRYAIRLHGWEPPTLLGESYSDGIFKGL